MSVHFNTVQEIFTSVFGDEEEVCLTTGFGIMAFGILDNAFHQFNILID
jgi:hypothetical protein